MSTEQTPTEWRVLVTNSGRAAGRHCQIEVRTPRDNTESTFPAGDYRPEGGSQALGPSHRPRLNRSRSLARWYTKFRMPEHRQQRRRRISSPDMKKYMTTVTLRGYSLTIWL